LAPNTEVLYKTTGYYSPECSRGIAWDDPALRIAWPLDGQAAVISEMDRRYPRLQDLEEGSEAAV
jgi:dTDP-4-dehydrorhamnose 3,5-epimerase